MSVTRKRDLHTDTPLWSSTPRTKVRSHQLPRKNFYDVVIVGAGISGALVADALASERRSILVIDRRQPVTGSSLASTAMILHEIDVPFGSLRKSIGAEKARRAWARSMHAVENLTGRISEAGIQCGFERQRALYIAGNALGWRALRDESELRLKAGFDAEFLDGAALRNCYGIDRTGAIRTACSAIANPAQMTAGFLRHAMWRGAELVCGPEIVGVDSVNGAVELELSTGDVLRAEHVVFCTGYEFLDKVANAGHSVVSTWAIATRPGIARPAWLDDCMVWEASDPYLYLRSTPDGRIVAGGEDEADPTAHENKDKMNRKQEVIAGKVADLLGVDIGEVEFAWAGAFGVTPNGLPVIDQVPGMSNVFTVMGFGGNGITFSQIASELVASRLEGRTDEDFDLFRFGSPPAPRKAA